MNWYGPLWEVAVRISDIGVWFLNTADNIRPVPIVGEFLADFFDTIGNIFGWCAFYLGEANWRIESLRIDTYLENVRDWVMEIGGATNWEKILYHDHLIAWILARLGFSEFDAFLFEASPEIFIRWKIATWWSFLEPLVEDPFGWIKEKIVERVPALGYLFEDPEGWVLYMLGVPWFERIFWSNHLLAWLLHRWGLSTADALMFEADPISWVRYQVLERWDFLDDLLLDPVGWFWKEFIEAVDRYIDVNVDWLVTTAARVLNTIWQTRI